MELIIRADASPQMGAGHVMRCLALAQAWLESGHGAVTFLMAISPLALEARLQKEGIRVAHLSVVSGSQEDGEQTAAWAQRTQASWVVVDGYQFDADYQRAIKAAGLKLLFIDDYGHAKHYWADLVLNQNVYADEMLYANREDYTKLLLGTQYALLRKEFWTWHEWQRQVPPTAKQVLVTLGGGDPDNVTLKVIRALEQVDIRGLEVLVVVGASNPHYEELRLAAGKSTQRITLRRNVADMPSLMAWADMAIAAGGSTCWELACFSLPSLMITLADNQKGIVQALDDLGVGMSLGWHSETTLQQIADAFLRVANSAQLRTKMSEKASKLVDASGSRRVISYLYAS